MTIGISIANLCFAVQCACLLTSALSLTAPSVFSCVCTLKSIGIVPPCFWNRRHLRFVPGDDLISSRYRLI
ncbi:hypothetical protein PF005_g32783 [Phytophthora fragariae]|uniref:RxLR effector protein n=1 Tax=Phytophthora fragariae TaxID=53985 RepID=A0A6A3V2K9_9STRA|nr:hypothetical protein PF009_g32678 [Phytophthora fragariae]KAE9056452.1 hypothetical protein PF006_g32672 [Phytophthora fragariae]KAE9157564.1 hypothetical protein PF005_g32783 [Phytophthora fragariae]